MKKKERLKTKKRIKMQQRSLYKDLRKIIPYYERIYGNQEGIGNGKFI